MAQQIKLKRSAVAGRVPTTSSLALGEIAINTADGKLFFQRGDSTIQSFFTTNALITGSLQQSGSDSYFLSNVGIGKDNPFYTLDVEGGARFQTTAGGGGDGVIQLGAVGNNGYSKFTMGKSGTPTEFQLFNAGDWRLGSYTNSDFSLYTSGSERVRIKNNGNVGIGYTTPATTLDVATNVNGFDYQIQARNLYSGGGAVASIAFTPSSAANSNSWGYVGVLRDVADSDNAKLVFGVKTLGGATLSDEKMRITNTGNVGIGTTTPSSKLHVSGTADVMLIEGSGSTTNTSIFAIDGNNGRLFEVSDDLSDSLFSVNTIAGLPVVEVFSDNRVIMGAFNQNDLVISGSRVGIGTATPSAKLDVIGDVKITGSLDMSGSINVTGDQREINILGDDGQVALKLHDTNAGATDTGKIGWYINGTLYGSITATGGSPTDGLIIRSEPNRAITFKTNGNFDRMIIQQDGNIGIGNNTPTEALTVEGNISGSGNLTLNGNIYKAIENSYLGLYGGSDNTDNDGFIKIHGNANYWGRVQTNIGYSSASSKAYWTLSNSTELMTLTGAGRLGIGVTSPTEKLTVEGNISASGNLYLDGAIFDSSDTSGSLGQVLTSIAGGTAWEDIDTAVLDEVENIYATVKNVSGVTLYKGTPVHAVSGSSSGQVNPVIAASASDATTMPATFILNQDINDEAEGQAIIAGHIEGVNTSAFNVGDIVYVGESGGYTNIKPTGSANLIQNLGVVTKIHASNGSGVIYGSGRSNDVPNLPVGKIWVGSDSYSVTSSLIHFDESNERIALGSNITTPNYGLDLQFSENSTRNVNIKNGFQGTGVYLENSLSNRQSTLTLANNLANRLILVAGGSNSLHDVFGTDDAKDVGAISSDFDNGFKIGTKNDAPLSFYQNSSQVVDINSSGVFITGSLTVSGSSTFTNIGPAVFSGSLTVADEDSTVPVNIIRNDSNSTLPVKITNNNASGRSGLTFSLPNNNNQAYSIGVDNDRNFKIGENNLGSNTRFVITPAGNVGIGTTSPGKTLTVAGTFQASGEAFFSHFDNITSNSRMRDDLYINYGTARVFRIGYNSTTDKLQFGSGSNAIMTLDGSGNLDVSGSGSFTNSLSVPDIYLENSIYHTGDTNTSFRFDNDQVRIFAANYTAFETTGYNGVVKIGATNNPQDIYLQNDAGVGLLLQKSTGKVGIGTTTPSQKLEVRDGNLIVSASQPQLILDPSNSFGHNFTILATGAHTVFSGSATTYFRDKFGTDVVEMTMSNLIPRVTFDANVNIERGLTVTGSVKFLDSDSLLTIEDGGSLLTDIKSNYNQLNFRPNGNQALVLNLTGHTSVNKTLSVGRILGPASAANYQLDVSGSGNFTDGLTVTGSINHDGDLTVTGTVTAQEFHTEFVSASIVYSSGSTKFGDTLDDIHQFTGSIELSGSQGIVRIGNPTEANFNQIYLYRPGNRSAITIDTDAGRSATLNFAQGGVEQFKVGMPIQDVGSLGQRFAISYQGNPNFVMDANGIAINKVNPEYDLDVSGSGRFTNDLTVTGSLEVSASIKMTGDGHSYTYPLEITSDSIKLPSDSTSSRSILRQAGSGTGAFLSLRDGSGNEKAIIRSYASSGVQAFFTAGNVGIGTTSPTTTLDVRGTISQIVDASANQYPLSFYNDHSGTDYYLLRQRVINSGNQVRTGLGITGAPDAAFVLGPQTDQVIKFDSSGQITNVSTINGLSTLKINSSEIRVGDTSGTVAANFNIVGDNDKVPLGIKQESGTTQNKFITFLDSGSVEVLGITTDGSFNVVDSNLIKRFSFGHGYAPSPADGMGIGLDLKTENASGAVVSVGSIDVIQDDVSADLSSMRISVGESTPTEVMRLQSDGNVGIGTSSPAYTLDVSGSSRFNNVVYVSGSDTSSATEAFKVVNSNGDIGIQVLNNGNVGIGGAAQTSPAYKLRVHGGLWATSFEQLSVLNGTAGVGSLYFYSGGSTFDMELYGPHVSEAVKGIFQISSKGINHASLATSILHADPDFLDNPSFVIRSRNASAESYAMMNYKSGSGFMLKTSEPAGTGTADMIFKPSGSEVLFLSSSGNVGIGTTDPRYATLQVQGSGLFSSTLQVQGNINLREDIYTLAHNGLSFIPTITRYDGGSELGLDYDYVRSINGNNGGNVGIGTTSPAAKLEVRGNLLMSGSNTFTAGNLSGTRIDTTQTTISGYYAAESYARFLIGRDIFAGGQAGIALGGAGGYSYIGTDGTNGNALIFSTDGSNTTGQGSTYEKMRIDSAGRLLLNATSTSFSDRLYINGDGYVNGGWRVGTSGTYVGKLYNTSGILTLESDSTRDIQFGSVTNGTAMFIEGSNGNIGVGIIPPSTSQRFTVSGSANQWGVVSLRGMTDSLTPPSYYYGAGNAHNFTRTIITGNNISIFDGTAAISESGYRIGNNDGVLNIGHVKAGVTQDSTVFNISASSVGIGTTTPETQLDITGDLTIGDKIYTRADSNRNTYIDSHTDTWSFVGGGNQLLALSHAGGAIFNEGGGDRDFRVESDTNTHMLFVDAGNNRVGISTSTPSEALTVAGNISGSGNLVVEGAIEGASKSFNIPHPTQPGRKLIYGSLEGPEHGVYCRGKIEGNLIELPEEWTGLVDEDTITVQLTSIGSHQNLYVSDIKDNKVFIKNGNTFSSKIKAFYFIQAMRKDIDKLQTVR